MSILECYKLGRVEYADGLSLMSLFSASRLEGKSPDSLLLLEHPPVITLGRGASPQNIVVSRELLDREGVEVFATDRGGDVTYHGPGQLVGYPILQLPQERQDVRRYVRDVEEAIIQALSHFGITAHRESRWPGVWVKGRSGLAKIAAIGVHISRWLTRHGFALNVHTLLHHFKLIVPCGIHEAGVTSMKEVLGETVSWAQVQEVVAQSFATVFGATIQWGKTQARTVCVVVQRRDGRVLLLKRKEEKGGFWQPVTGYVEGHETPLQAAKRELVEETGIRLAPHSLDYEHVFARGETLPPILTKENAFVVVAHDETVKLDASEHTAYEWVSRGEAVNKVPHAGLKTAIQRAARFS